MPLPFEIIETPGAEALERLRNLSMMGGAQGFVPVILGNVSGADASDDNSTGSYDAEVAADIDQFSIQPDAVDEVLNRLRGQLTGDDEEFEDNFDSVSVSDIPNTPVKSPGLTAHLEILSGRPKAKVHIAKIPTTEPWLVPLYLHFGGWNSCPFPVEHAILAKHWFDKYGAQIVSNTQDVMEYQVSRPPTTKEDALQLAKEQYTYCNDIVDQGVGDIQTLAATLLNSKTWYFWWD